jgi:hypothetical protein
LEAHIVRASAKINEQCDRRWNAFVLATWKAILRLVPPGFGIVSFVPGAGNVSGSKTATSLSCRSAGSIVHTGWYLQKLVSRRALWFTPLRYPGRPN